MYMMVPHKNNVMTREFRDPFFDNFFGSFFGSENEMMRADVRELEDRYELSVDLPGIEKEAISVEAHDGVLVITAGREEKAQSGEDDRYVYRERKCGRMSRSFNLEGVDEGAITAQYRDGVLQVNLPKSKPEESQSRKIEIQ